MLHEHDVDLLEGFEVARRRLLLFGVGFELTRRHFDAHLDSNKTGLLHLNDFAFDIFFVFEKAFLRANGRVRAILRHQRQTMLLVNLDYRGCGSEHRFVLIDVCCRSEGLVAQCLIYKSRLLLLLLLRLLVQVRHDAFHALLPLVFLCLRHRHLWLLRIRLLFIGGLRCTGHHSLATIHLLLLLCFRLFGGCALQQHRHVLILEV